jgi:hypothetical protein
MNNWEFLGAHSQQSRSNKAAGRHHGSVVVPGAKCPVSETRERVHFRKHL